MQTRTITQEKTVNKVRNKKPDMPIRESVVSKLEQNDENNFDISVMISDIYHNSLYLNWNNPNTGSKYAKFEEYCNNELKISYRTAMWYVGNGDGIKGCGLNKDDIDGVGFSIFKEIASLLNQDGMNRDSALELINSIEGMTHKEVAEFVKSQRLKREATGDKSMTIKYNFNNEQVNTVNSAHQKCEELTGMTNPNTQAEYIFADWLMHYSDDFNENVMDGLVGTEHLEDEKAPHKQHANKGKKG